MPLIETNDIRTYYEVHGQGPPLLLINGYGDHTGHWFRMLPWLMKSFKLVIYDNRGAGRSDAPDIPYTMKMLADDAVSLMDSLGISKSHVFGVSMGGMVAQEIALNYPEKVNRLILGCTLPGGVNTVYPEAEVLAFLLDDKRRAQLSLTDIASEMWEYTCLDDFRRNHPEVGEEYVRISVELPACPHGLKGQGDAIAIHDTYDRLPGLKAPTLVMAGQDDKLVPIENTKILAARIPVAHAIYIKNAGHGFFYEAAEEASTIIKHFLLGMN